MTRRDWQKITEVEFEIMDEADIHAVLCIHGFGKTATLIGQHTVNVFELCQATIPKPFFGRACMTADWAKTGKTRTLRNQVHVELYTDGRMPDEALDNLWRWVVMTAITAGCHETIEVLWQHDQGDRIARDALSEPTHTNGQPIGLKDITG